MNSATTLSFFIPSLLRDRKMSLIQMSSVEEAIQALMDLHNYDMGGNHHLKVSFSKSTIWSAMTRPALRERHLQSTSTFCLQPFYVVTKPFSSSSMSCSTSSCRCNRNSFSRFLKKLLIKYSSLLNIILLLREAECFLPLTVCTTLRAWNFTQEQLKTIWETLVEFSLCTVTSPRAWQLACSQQRPPAVLVRQPLTYRGQ